MSIYRAKEVFLENTQRPAESSTEALQALNEGLHQLALGLQLELERLHQEVAHISQQIKRPAPS